MAAINRLSAALVDAARRGKARIGYHADGGGLLLQVAKGGSASWVFRFQRDGLRKELGLGGLSTTGLASARAKAAECRRVLGEGGMPKSSRQAVRERAGRSMAFDDAAHRLIAAKSPEWKNAKHGEQWRNTLATYASPILGSMPVDAIELKHIESVLSPIWTTRTETASRVRMRIEAVLDWATVAGHRTGENPARWRGNLEHILAKPSKVAKVRSQPALPYAELQRFFPALRQRSGAARALEFQILTAARSGEVRGAVWSEMDLGAKTWTVPVERMKSGREHVVPLCRRALDILAEVPRLDGISLVFASPTGGELSDATLAKVIKDMHAADIKAGGGGFLDPKSLDKSGTARVAVPHGFRSTFRDWCAECTDAPREIAEAALAHVIVNKVEAAYRRGDLLSKRRALMADWAKFAQSGGVNS